MEKLIKRMDEEFPKKLLEIKNAPSKLYVRGDEKLLNNNCFAIVGSRNCTEYGFNIAKQFAQEMSKSNITIVSGLAQGIDTASHLGAINQKGKTIAVLGHGFKYIYPEKNKELYERILEEGGCIITEYEFEVEPKSTNFPKRNRIISGLSMGVLVVEAIYRSGSTITAKYAKEQEKKIFCIPRDLGISQGIGTNKLIQQGNKLVIDVNDILEEYNFDRVKITEETKPKERNIEQEYKPIYELLSNIPININEICIRSNIKIAKVNQIITMLEIGGYIKELPGKEFIRGE